MVQVKPRVNKANTAVETQGVKHSMNPFDELSIEEAVRMRERKNPVEDILAFSAGPTKSQDILRTAMAMGADRGIHVVEEKQEIEPLAVAKLLQKVVEEENRNLVILGKQSIDDDAQQTGQMLAGLLGWSQATQASKVELVGASGCIMGLLGANVAIMLRAWLKHRAPMARQILLLLDGSFAVVLLHRDASYMETAGEAARTLIETALAMKGPKRRQATSCIRATSSGKMRR